MVVSSAREPERSHERREPSKIEEEPRVLPGRQPFAPLRIKLVNGDGHDAAYPDLVAILEEGAYVTSDAGHRGEFPFDRIASFESLIADFHAGPPLA